MSPNNKQLTKLFQYAGCARFAYNWAITREQENYKQGGEFLSDSKLRKEFTQLKKLEKYKWLNEVSNDVTNKQLKMLVMPIRDFLKDNVNILNLKAKSVPLRLFIKIILRSSLPILM